MTISEYKCKNCYGRRLIVDGLVVSGHCTIKGCICGRFEME